MAKKKKGKKRRTAAQKAATAKLVAYNKKRRKKSKPKAASKPKKRKKRAKHTTAPKKRKAARRTGTRGMSLTQRLLAEKHAALRSALSPEAQEARLVAQEAKQTATNVNNWLKSLATTDPEAALEAANAARAAKVAAELAADAARKAAKPQSRLIGGMRRFYGRPAGVSRQLELALAKKNPGKKRKRVQHTRRKVAKRAGGAWWIADIHFRTRGSKRAQSLCYIGRGTKAEAEASAKKLLAKHAARSVELSGPYSERPSPHAVRR